MARKMQERRKQLRVLLSVHRGGGEIGVRWHSTVVQLRCIIHGTRKVRGGAAQYCRGQAAKHP